MSGAESGLVIGLISGVITIIHTTKQVYDAAKETKGQPEVFGKVAARLPLVLSILQRTKTEVEKVDEHKQDEIELIMKACRDKAEELQKIFTKVVRKDEDNWLDRYKKAFIAVKSGKTLEKLMEEVLKDIQMVACDKLVGLVTEGQRKDLADAIKEMKEMELSIPNESVTATVHQSNYGGNNAIQAADGKMNNVFGGTYQEIAGNATFGSNNDHVAGSKVMGDLVSAVFFNFNHVALNLKEDFTTYDRSPSEHELAQFPKFRDYEELRCLPIFDISIAVEVMSIISRTTLKQTFVNISDVRITEANYNFPLYDGATITAFKCSIGDVKLEGRVKPKGGANVEYTKALAEQHTTVLLQEEMPDIFEARLGNIPPKTCVEVEIVLICELQRTFDGGVLVTIPTSVAPKYDTPSLDHIIGLTHAASVGYREGGLRINIAIVFDIPIRKLVSLTHPISEDIGISKASGDLASPLESLEFDSRRAHVSFSHQTVTLDKDFVLTVDLDPSSVSCNELLSDAIMEMPLGSSTGPAVMVSVCSREFMCSEYLTEHFEGEIIFIADRSGSMNGVKMGALQEALHIFLEHLPDRCNFNIYSFGSRLTTLWVKSKQLSQATLDEAKQHINSFSVEMGGKTLLPVLNYIVEQQRGCAASVQVILLTDGDLRNTEDVADCVEKAVKDSQGALRFFPIGICYAIPDKLVTGKVERGGWFGEVMVVDRKEQWAEIADRILEASQSPWKFDITLSGLGKISSNVQMAEHSAMPPRYAFPETAYIQAPYSTRSLNPLAWFRIYFLFQDNQNTPIQSATIKATSLSGHVVSKEIQVRSTQFTWPTIHRLAAKAIMLDLDAGKSWTDMHALHSDIKNQQPASAEAIGNETERIGMKWSIAGKWTSFVAVDRNNEEKMTGFYKALPLRPLQGPDEVGHGVNLHKRSSSPMYYGRESRERARKKMHIEDHRLEAHPRYQGGQREHLDMGLRHRLVQRMQGHQPGHGAQKMPPLSVSFSTVPRTPTPHPPTAGTQLPSIRSLYPQQPQQHRVHHLFQRPRRRPQRRRPQVPQQKVPFPPRNQNFKIYVQSHTGPLDRRGPGPEVLPFPLYNMRAIYFDLLLSFLLFIMLELMAPFNLLCCLAFLYLLYWRMVHGMVAPHSQK